MLTLLLDLQLSDVGLEIARGRQGAADVSNQVGLLCAEFEQLLRLLEERLLLRADVLFYLVHHFLGLFKLRLGIFVRLLQGVLQVLFAHESVLRCLVAFLRGIESLHLLFKNLVDIGHVGALVGQFSRECRELVF